MNSALKAENQALADKYAQPGTVKHFALRLGFMPHDEAAAEAILEGLIKQGEDHEMGCAERIAELEKFQNQVLAELAAEGAGTFEHLLACAMLGKHCSVIGNTRYAQLKAAEEELALWKPMTAEEAEAVFEAAEASPLSDEEIDRIVEQAMDPAYRPSNAEYAQMAVRIKRLEAQLAEARRELERWATVSSERNHGASGLCCQLRLHEKQRADELAAALERLTRQATMTDDYRDAADGTLHSSVRQALKALGKESVADV